eukprot:5825804-Pyramimonas_sp.AAC.1
MGYRVCRIITGYQRQCCSRVPGARLRATLAGEDSHARGVDFAMCGRWTLQSSVTGHPHQPSAYMLTD